MDDLAVIIVTWNSAGFIEACLTSVEEARNGLGIRVFVVDNGSSDNTEALVRSQFPEVDYVQNTGKTGFAAANNIALGRAEARYVLLLNPDTTVKRDCLKTMVRFMDSRPSCWAAGPAILNGDGSPQRTGVRFPNSWNILMESLFLDRLAPRTRLFGSHRELYRDPSVARQVDYLQGACLIVRSAAIGRIGNLDEGFTMYFEETDWCYRVKRAGGEVWYTPDGSVVHFGGGDFGHYDERRLVYYHAGLLRFYAKHYGLWSSLVLRPVLILRSVVRCLIWAAIALARSSSRSRAYSSFRGYVRSFAIILGITSPR